MRIPRRALFALPFAFAGLAGVLYRRERTVPDGAESGSGAEVVLVLVNAEGRKIVKIRKIVKTERQWRDELTSEQFGIARRGGTEFAYSNAYWKIQNPGIYRCVCCGTAVFRSEDKFDSGTGWPSFTQPAAPENISTKPDRSLSVERVEVLCRKCDAHLGHVFEDGPEPSGLRYCMNSAALWLQIRG